MTLCYGIKCSIMNEARLKLLTRKVAQSHALSPLKTLPLTVGSFWMNVKRAHLQTMI